SSGHLDVVQYLLDTKDVNVEAVDASSWTALHIAASAGQEEVVRLLIGAGADVNRRNDKGMRSQGHHRESRY
ncbi:ankyrin repeat-containing domain protein, partial [Pterulicium gracile]